MQPHNVTLNQTTSRPVTLRVGIDRKFVVGQCSVPAENASQLKFCISVVILISRTLGRPVVTQQTVRAVRSLWRVNWLFVFQKAGENKYSW
jgi:hypothetical protein